MTLARLTAILGCAGLLTACGPRVLIVTGTTLGLKASPGEPNGGRPPQVTFGYKRAETAIVPTAGDVASCETADPTTDPPADAYSTLATFLFHTLWWGETRLDSFIATGFAARSLAQPDAVARDPGARRDPTKPLKNSFADALLDGETAPTTGGRR